MAGGRRCGWPGRSNYGRGDLLCDAFGRPGQPGGDGRRAFASGEGGRLPRTPFARIRARPGIRRHSRQARVSWALHVQHRARAHDPFHAPQPALPCADAGPVRRHATLPDAQKPAAAQPERDTPGSGHEFFPESRDSGKLTRWSMKTSASVELFARAQRITPGGVNSPVRAFRGVGGTPLFIARGEGSRIFDVDGNSYIDYVGSWGPLIMGHRPPFVTEALGAALEIGTSFGAPTERE